MSEQWMPVAKLKDELSDKLGDWYLGLDSEDAIYIAESDSGAVYRIYLPDDLRLCRRVDDEPITPEALEREGWQYNPIPKPQYHVMYKTLRNGRLLGWSDASQVISMPVHATIISVEYPGCKTMAQLRELVTMLGGG